MIRAAQVLAAFFLLSTVSWAQTAQIQGTVQDASDAAVPGADGLERTVTLDGAVLSWWHGGQR